MGVLEKVTEMQKEGASPEEIISSLREQGISPREINDAISQSNIKNAVSGFSGQNKESEEMESSVMNNEDELTPPQPSPVQRPQSLSKTREENGYYTPGQRAEQRAPEQYSEEPEEYYQESQDYYGTESNTDVFIEIAEQVYQEKIKDIERQVEQLNEMKTIAQIKLDNLTDRLRRIEIGFDRMQAAILNKIGAYADTLDGIKKEMSMLEDSFGKIASHHQQHQPAHKPEFRHKIIHKKSRR